MFSTLHNLNAAFELLMVCFCPGAKRSHKISNVSGVSNCAGIFRLHISACSLGSQRLSLLRKSGYFRSFDFLQSAARVAKSPILLVGQLEISKLTEKPNKKVRLPRSSRRTRKKFRSPCKESTNLLNLNF